MATAAELDIILGAKVDGGIANINKFNNALVKTEQTATKFATKSTRDFTSFSRVIQDLPFGFVAISNNLEQIVSSAIPLGLVFSAIVSTLTFLQIGFRNWTGRVKESKEAADEFAKSLNKAKSGAIETGVKLQAFVDIARDTTKSLSERNLALDEANKLMGEHGKKLTLVSINTKDAKEEVEKYTQALIAQAVASKYSDKIADLIIKQTDASIAYGKALRQYNTIAKETEDINKNTFSGGTGGVGGLGNTSTTTKVLGALNSLKAATSNYKDITADLGETNANFNENIAKSIKLFADLGTKTDDTKKKAKELSDFFLADTNIKDIPKKYLDAIAVETGDHINQIITKSADNIKPGVQALAQSFSDTFNDEINNTLSSGITDAFAAIGESIGKGQNPLSGLLDVLGGVLEELGKRMIKLAAIVTSIRIGFNTLNPFVLAAGGIALIALGNALENAVPKFASGGVVTKPTLLLAGERGPERITPIGYEGSAGETMVKEYVFKISGSDLIAVSKRANNNAYYTF